jgi:hypothetical protein
MRATLTAISGILLIGASRFQSATQTFVIRAEADTVAVEQLTRSADSLAGDLHLYEEKSRVHYVLHLRADGSTESAEVANEAPNFFTGTVLFGGPSGNMGQAGVAGRVVRVPAKLVPIIGTSMGLMDHLIRLHTPEIGRSVAIDVLNIRNGKPGRVTIKRITSDSVVVDCDGCMRQRVNEELRVGLSHDGGVAGAVRVERHWTVERR